MVTVLKPGATKKSIQDILEKLAKELKVMG